MTDYVKVGIAVIPVLYDVDPEDQQAIGIHFVDVKKGLRPDTMASAALDVFHENVAIGMLDDFEFAVFNPETGRVIPEDPDHESYSMSHFGEYSHQATETPPVFYGSIEIHGIGG